MENLQYQLGQKLIREGDGKIFWATDSNYTFETSHKSRRRRDIVMLEGTEKEEYILPTGEHVEKTNPLCGEIVKISDMGDIKIPRKLCRDKSSTQLDPTFTLFILLRYFTPDTTRSFQRDSLHRPLCIGPLRINHCAWRYAQAKTYRQSISTVLGKPNKVFHTYRHMFGKTHDDQLLCFEMEKKSYYGLVSPNNVLRTVCMSPGFLPHTATPDFSTWLETVTYH